MSFSRFWKEGPFKVHEVDNVRFHSTLINPIAESNELDRYPLVIWFGGLGPSGLDGIGVELGWLSRVTSKPFVLVAPIRSPTTWWVLNDNRFPLGCVIGSLLDCEVVKYCRWIETLAGASGIDSTSVSLFGGRAGAYAISEIIASGTCELHCVGLAALHGHGQPDLDGLDEECTRSSDKIIANWSAYIDRIRNHITTPNILIGVHTEEDTYCPWKYAHGIYKAFDHGRNIRQLSPTTLVKVEPSEKRTSYNYVPEAMKLFLQLAFGDEEGSKRMLASHSSLDEPTSVPVPVRPVDAVSSSGQSFGSVRSRSLRRALHVAPAMAVAPRPPVGQDGPLPVDHFGCMSLGGGMSVLYIAHSDTIPAQGLWPNAMVIGQSESIKNMVYFDCKDGGELCDRVCTANLERISSCANDFFMCTEVAHFLAVGLGGNSRKRQRASRIAAAVAFELQAGTPVEEFRSYPELQSLIRQVRSRFNFDVR